MAIVALNDEYLTDIADSIRTKLGVQTTYKPSEMAGAIESISGGGITPTGTKQISIIQNGTTTENVSDYASAEITVEVPNSYSVSDEGKVVDNGALVSQTAHADVTPTTSDQTIDTTTNNSIKVKGDADLVAGNIKKDVEIFGVTGSYEGGGASFATGSYTPSTNESSIDIDTNGNYDHFIIYAETEPAGHGAKANRAAIVDFAKASPILSLFMTNSTGSGVTAANYTTGYFSKNGTVVTCGGNNSYYISGITYVWLAW